jgi:transcriptional regulator with XRE-family HTH domain
MSTQVDADPGVIGDLLLREMETRNWSQRETAKACQLSNTTISKIVRGQSIPDPNTCFKLAQGLELPAPYVLRLAGHEIAQVRTTSPSLEALLHAQFDRLPERAIQEMLGAIRTIENAYTRRPLRKTSAWPSKNWRTWSLSAVGWTRSSARR